MESKLDSIYSLNRLHKTNIKLNCLVKDINLKILSEFKSKTCYDIVLTCKSYIFEFILVFHPIINYCQ